jgi:hypothetical protein
MSKAKGGGRRGASRSGGGLRKDETSPAQAELAGQGETGIFGPSNAKVTFPDGEAETRANVKRVMGRDLSNQELASLVGAPDGAKVAVTPGYYGNSIQLSVQHPSIENAGRTLSRNQAGDLVMHNDIFRVKEGQGGQGFGFEMVGRQMENARKLGVKRVETHAARSDGPGGYVGYKVWPKIGYDAALPSSQRAALPPGLKGAQRVSDLYRTKEGREWWEKNGQGLEMTFDLSPGSYSLKKMASYFAERAKRGKTGR